MAAVKSGDLVPLAPPPASTIYASPSALKVREVEKAKNPVRREELKRGHDVKVLHHDTENLVLVCVATHRRCPYQLCISRLPDNAACSPLSYPFCVTHNHPPLFPPVDYPKPTPLPDPTEPVPPPKFSDLVYSISPSLSIYLPRLEGVGFTADFSVAALAGLPNAELETFFADIGMKVFERKVLVAGLKKALEKRKRDQRRMHILGPGDDGYSSADLVMKKRLEEFEKEYYYDGGEVLNQQWEDWLCETLNSTKGEREMAYRLSKESDSK